VLFVASGGTPIFKQLKEGEAITVDSRSVTMIENTANTCSIQQQALTLSFTFSTTEYAV
jgi:uncharacterized protein (AIM24 family)